MIQMIEAEPRLKSYLHRKIEDAGVSVAVDDKLQEKEYIGIKVDDYYAGKHEKVIPSAVDFIVAVDCACSWYVLYILELKGVKNTCSTKSIHAKFDTAINQFMGNEFKDIFHNDKFKYRDVQLYLVTTSYGKAMQMGKFEEYLALRNKIKAKDTLQNDSTLSDKLYKFRGKICSIRREVPPNPLIRKVLHASM